MSILPIAGHTLAISYAFKFRNGRELTISPRIRFAESNPHSNVRGFAIFKTINEDPWWYYDQRMLRVGIMFPLGDDFFFEPQLQVGYASFNNKLIYKGDDSRGVAFDRKYSTVGVVNTICWVRNFNGVRVKVFFGLGAHERKYHETRYQNLYPPAEPDESTYWKSVFTLHAGLEFGVRF